MKKTLALILLPNAALAHAGDHAHLNALVHLLTEPDHLVMIGAAVVLGLILRKVFAK